jgi:hypothetical protein
MRLVLVLAALLLAGCATSLPSMQTEAPWAGRCHTIHYIPLLDMRAYMTAEAMEGWKCAGLSDGSPPRTGTRDEFRAALKAKNEAALEAIRMKKPLAAPALPRPGDRLLEWASFGHALVALGPCRA